MNNLLGNISKDDSNQRQIVSLYKNLIKNQTKSKLFQIQGHKDVSKVNQQLNSSKNIFLSKSLKDVTDRSSSNSLSKEKKINLIKKAYINNTIKSEKFNDNLSTSPLNTKKPLLVIDSLGGSHKKREDITKHIIERRNRQKQNDANHAHTFTLRSGSSSVEQLNGKQNISLKKSKPRDNISTLGTKSKLNSTSTQELRFKKAQETINSKNKDAFSQRLIKSPLLNQTVSTQQNLEQLESEHKENQIYQLKKKDSATNLKPEKDTQLFGGQFSKLGNGLSEREEYGLSINSTQYFKKKIQQIHNQNDLSKLQQNKQSAQMDINNNKSSEQALEDINNKLQSLINQRDSVGWPKQNIIQILQIYDSLGEYSPELIKILCQLKYVTQDLWQKNYVKDQHFQQDMLESRQMVYQMEQSIKSNQNINHKMKALQSENEKLTNQNKQLELIIEYNKYKTKQKSSSNIIGNNWKKQEQDIIQSKKFDKISEISHNSAENTQNNITQQNQVHTKHNFDEVNNVSNSSLNSKLSQIQSQSSSNNSSSMDMLFTNGKNDAPQSRQNVKTGKKQQAIEDNPNKKKGLQLNLAQIKQNNDENKGFHEEFMARMDEFSNSWREAAQLEKKFQINLYFYFN